MSTSSEPARILLVIGGTGAQGMPVIRALLQPTTDGKPSPWAVRIITRDPTHRRAKELEALGVEIYKGSFLDYETVANAMKGAYGAWVNTDGFTVGEIAETFASIRIYEAAKAAGLRHFIYSSLDYMLKKGGFNPIYKCDHYDGKGRFVSYLQAQPNEINDPSGLMWTVVTNAPYMDMLNALLAPIQAPDGTFVFAAPIGDGHIPLITTKDLGFWARHLFDNPSTENTGVDLEITSEMVSYPHLVETFTRVTGKRAVYARVTMDEYFGLLEKSTTEGPVASGAPDGSTFRECFTGFWAGWRDDIVTRDMDYCYKIHPGTTSLEQWMRETGYDGTSFALLKDVEDHKLVIIPNMEVIMDMLSA